MKSCYFCEAENVDFADTYDDVFHICPFCLLKRKEKWESLKESWAEADYKYD